MAGFNELDAYGILNILPTLVENFGMNRNQILLLPVKEVYYEIQRISTLNWANKNYMQLIEQKNKI